MLAMSACVPACDREVGARDVKLAGERVSGDGGSLHPALNEENPCHVERDRESQQVSECGDPIKRGHEVGNLSLVDLVRSH